MRERKKNDRVKDESDRKWGGGEEEQDRGINEKGNERWNKGKGERRAV